MNNKFSAFLGFKKKIITLASSIGPGIFIMGYIIGTGSVTTMVSSGAKYGMSLTWALIMSCIFTYVMITAISKCTIITGQTLLYNFKTYFGRWVTIFIILSLMTTSITSIIGVMAIVSDVVSEWSKALTTNNTVIDPIWFAIFFSLILYYLFWNGKHNFFLKTLAVMVGLMGICFIVSVFMVIPEPSEVIKGLVPKVAAGGNSHLIIAGIVGTTMASVVLMTRSILVHERGWSVDDFDLENRDAIISMVLTFLVSAAIMATAAGTMFPRGIEVDKAIDMVHSLEPLAGRFAVSIFVTGIICAGLSSLFPNFVLLPWLICDYMNIQRNMKRKLFRVIVFLMALNGLVVPVFGGKPVLIMIASQAVSPVVMPLITIFLIILLNNKKIVGKYKNGILMNTALATTLIFSLFMCYSAIIGLKGFLHTF